MLWFTQPEGGDNMAAEMRRFTISVTPDMEKDLDFAKKTWYCEKSQNEMMKDLIIRGLNLLKGEHRIGTDSHEKTA